MAVPGSEVSASQIRTAMAGPSSTAATPLGALYRDNDAGTPGTALQPPNMYLYQMKKQADKYHLLNLEVHLVLKLLVNH